MEKKQSDLFDGRYRLNGLLGKGTSAKVFRAVDTREDKEVAIKIFDEAYMADAEAKRQFDHEIKACALLDTHPNVVSYYSGSIKEGCRYIVMEVAIGETLTHYMNLKGGKLPCDEALSYFCQILAALAHAHSKGIIHRDVKPQNVRLVANGMVKLVDFGIALIPGFENTSSGKAVGTVNYISPEQATAGKVDARSDIYSAGVLLYEMLTGYLPFYSDKTNPYDRMDEIIRKHLKEPPARPSVLCPNIPVAIEQIVLRAMNKNPAKRFESAQDMLRYIKLYYENPRIVFHFDLPSDPYNAYDALPEETDAERFVPTSLKLVGTVREKEKSHQKEASKKSTSKRTTLFLVAATVTLLAVLILISVLVVGRLFFYDAGETTVITRGNLVNTEYNEQLAQILQQQGYEVEVQYQYHETLPLNTIISQEPGAQAVQIIPTGDKPKLLLTVSGGCRVILMPEYIGKEYRQALLELASMGFEENDEITVIKQYSDTIGEGIIIATEPSAGEATMQNQPIKLYVSMGKETVYRYVPNLLGLSAEEAIKSLEDAKIPLGKIHYEESDAPAGEVIAQSRPYGEKLAIEYYSIEITVSKGKILS